MDLTGWSGQAGQVIRVKALDDVQVTVSVSDPSGALLEQGAAKQVDSLWWEYTTSSTGSGNLKVLAAAQDLPGNVTEMSKASA